MRILLTNDDGIGAEGLLAVYSSLKKIADVDVVAPLDQKSSIGHAITLSQPLFAKNIFKNKKKFGTAISGTPADCVKFAIGVLKIKPDLIISGINLGHNDGCSVFYSGTVAGAREAALLGYPAMAVSLATFQQPDYSYAAKLSSRLAKKMIEFKFPYGKFLNVNIPNLKQKEIKGVRITRQCTDPIHGLFYKNINPHGDEYYWMSGKIPSPQKDVNIDTYALQQKYVTVTPIQNDLTDASLLEEIKNWDL
ncbi:MAG: 5'/3'-nucleotidase SurE [Candidatus Omnitrophica bacterium]|nr:5'/3'-nucleotidase SurE [Candidatus Omnitrophota bacterium]